MPDFSRHPRFPGFQVDPEDLPGARCARVREAPPSRNGVGPLHWWTPADADSLVDDWPGFATGLLLIGLGIMLLDLSGLLGGFPAGAIIWGPMLGFLVAAAVVRRVWKAGDARRTLRDIEETRRGQHPDSL